MTMVPCRLLSVQKEAGTLIFRFHVGLFLKPPLDLLKTRIIFLPYMSVVVVVRDTLLPERSMCDLIQRGS